jgi:hypothetical protein
MKNASSNEVKRGQAVSFRVPSDTPDHILKHLQKLKETERRNFSSKIAEYVMQGVGNSLSKERETVTIPLPKNLTKAQRDWLKHEHSEALLGSIIYQLISNPVRSTALLAALNSNSVDIEEALYLQEEEFQPNVPPVGNDSYHEVAASLEEAELDADFEDDLNSFDWETAREKHSPLEEVNNEEEDVESLLGGFLANMNK